MRRATASFNAAQPATQNFYPRSPCGERPLCCRSQARPFSISIHALLAESDLRAEGPKKARYKFLSTLSLRRATATPRAGRQAAAISIHALLAESDFFPCVIFAVACQFLSTLSLRRATYIKREFRRTDTISIHALLAESDVTGTAKCFALNAFLSTLSLRRATWRAAFQRLRDSYFYPRSPCGERPFMGTNTIGRLYISIHALLAESDAAELTTSFFDLNFYPRSPCGERPKFLMMLQSSIKFLSTLSLRRATVIRHGIAGVSGHISIHALLAESDEARSSKAAAIWKFLSTLSLRRATRRSSFSLLSLLNFYPRSPCGERLYHNNTRLSNHTFLSTLSLRRATILLGKTVIRILDNFYPRSPCGERPSQKSEIFGMLSISIHALLAESDRKEMS